MVSIDFEQIFPYRPYPTPNISGTHPLVPVRLTYKGKAIDEVALLDSGATYCLFSYELAESLEINMSDGELMRLTSLGGGLEGRLHTINLALNHDYEFNDCEVVFCTSRIPRNILGRHSLFDKIKVGFAELHEEIYFSPNPQR